MFKAAAKATLTHIPYKSSTTATSDLLAGRVQVLFNQVVNFQAHIQAGKLTALAVAGPKRIPQLPNVPTSAEAGLPGYEVSIWFGLIAPRGIPQDMVTKLNSEVRRALALKEVQDGLTLQGFEPTASTPEQFSALIAAESVKWLPRSRNREPSSIDRRIASSGISPCFSFDPTASAAPSISDRIPSKPGFARSNARSVARAQRAPLPDAVPIAAASFCRVPGDLSRN
jgi:hypothetical protein